MTERDTAQAINDRATQWVARVDAGPLDTVGQAELDRWLARDARHRGAFFRATVAWRMLDRASVLAGGERSVSVVEEESRDYTAPVARRGLLWGGGAIAASMVAATFGWQMLSPKGQSIQTAAGEIRHVPLSDGSSAALNTATTLNVDFSAAQRNVRLDNGEAWFEVAKDASRPFVVASGDVRVRAVGTAFSVQHLSLGADVQVTEGTVEVWVVGHERDRVRVSAGTRTLVSATGGPRPAVADAAGIERKLAWRDGALRFEGDTLGAAAAEFNRYNRIKLHIDPALANETIVGRFRIHEPAAFARATSTMFDAQMHQDKDAIRIARQ